MKKKSSSSIFRIDPEYYTFISGALISIPLSLMFKISDNYRECSFWIGLALSIFASFFCFKLAILLKGVHEDYASNKIGVGDPSKAWTAAIKGAKTQCTTYLVLTVVTLALSIACVCLMQFTDTSSTTMPDVMLETTQKVIQK